MAEMSLESLPCLIYVYVGTRSQGSILQCLVKPTLLDKQSIRRLDGNEYATLRLLCFWLGCWLRWDFNIICLFICRCSLYINRNNSILGMLLEPRISFASLSPITTSANFGLPFNCFLPCTII